jgi:AraC-like DNA-binding protein
MHSTSFRIDPDWLRRYRHFESANVNDSCQRIAEILQPHRLTPGLAPPASPTYMNHVRFRGMAFGSLRYGGAMVVEAGRLADYYLVILSLSGYGDISAGSRRVIVGQSQGVVIGPQTSFRGIFSKDCEQFFIRIDNEAMRSHSRRESLELEPVIDLARPELGPWLAQLQLLASSPSLVALAQGNGQVAADLERLLVSLFIAGQPACTTHQQDAAMVLVPGVVRRAEAFIDAHAAEPLCLADIARASGAPVRTLLDAFSRFRGTSPMQAVREARMERARAMLMKADDGARVADIATHCGFVNLGRFAQAYRQRFGELPSDTLRAVRLCADLFNT